MNIEEKINELEHKIEGNCNEIISNMNKLHSHEEKINKNTGAIEVLHAIKSYNNRFFIMWIITFCAFLGLLVFTIYTINDIGINEENSIEIQDVETIDNSHIKIGDDIWEKSK